MRTNGAAVPIGSSARSMALPNKSIIRCFSVACRNWWRVTSLLMRVKSMPGLTSARRSNSRSMCPSSTESFFRNLRRAGMLKNKFFTIRLLPGVATTGSWLMNLDSDKHSFDPISSPLRIVRNSICATEAIEGSASPRNPMVCSA